MGKWPDDYMSSYNANIPTGSEWPAFRAIFDADVQIQDGRLRVSENRVIEESTFQYDKIERKWSYSGSVGGYSTFVPSGSYISLRVDGTGSVSKMRSDSYTHYVAGQITTLQMAASVKNEPTVARWGFFDDRDGLFFMCSGSDLYTVIRSSSTGQTIETVVSSSDWNVSRLDGTDSTGDHTDVNRNNLYDIKYQWFGSGLVKWSIGNKIVHVDDLRGQQLPYMSKGDAIVSAEIEGPRSASFNMTCCATSEEDRKLVDSHGRMFSISTPQPISLGATEAHLISIRPALTSSYGEKYRTMVLPRALVVLSDNKHIFVNSYISSGSNNPASGSWVRQDGSTVETMVSSSFAFSLADKVNTTIVSQDDVLRLDLNTIFSINGVSLTVLPFENLSKVFTVTGKVFGGAGTTDVFTSIVWEEII